jgi:nickel-dependent lactate racemase
MKAINVPNLLWYGNEPMELRFPDRWETQLLEPPGFKKPAIDNRAISKAFENPIGSPTLNELAREYKEVVVVFDDITRPTPTKVVLPWVLEALKEAGIPDENIRFIPALGMHGAMNNIDFRKKLGNDIVEAYPVYNHNPYENCDYLGESPSGVPVYINREFMSCDLRIGIGCITAHVQVGFGGGGKIVLPGVSGAETIKAFHRDVMMHDPSSIGLGKCDGNVMYAEIEQVARMAGLQFKIDALINEKGEITDLFVGDPVEAYKVGLEEAKEHYGTTLSPAKDIIVANAYAKYNEMAICMLMSLMSVNLAKGVIVLVVNSPEGQVCHYLWRSYGKEYGGELYLKRGAPPEGVKVIVCSQYPDLTMCDLFASTESVTLTRDWDETLALLEAEYPEAASVGVIPDGTMQYFKD